MASPANVADMSRVRLGVMQACATAELALDLATTDDHEDRLRQLESRRWPWRTITVLVAVAAVVVALAAQESIRTTA
ncbi:hypothetical protein AB0J38_32935 [Streptomyces sp. NPDC050095]|uniref:hypothetical protein n=1 Tax=unclassified Streptomyces TaxID=2593676 RepID=UPI0034275663